MNISNKIRNISSGKRLYIPCLYTYYFIDTKSLTLILNSYVSHQGPFRKDTSSSASSAYEDIIEIKNLLKNNLKFHDMKFLQNEVDVDEEDIDNDDEQRDEQRRVTMTMTMMITMTKEDDNDEDNDKGG